MNAYRRQMKYKYLFKRYLLFLFLFHRSSYRRYQSFSDGIILWYISSRYAHIVNTAYKYYRREYNIISYKWFRELLLLNNTYKLRKVQTDGRLHTYIIHIIYYIILININYCLLYYLSTRTNIKIWNYEPNNGHLSSIERFVMYFTIMVVLSCRCRYNM